MANSEDLQWRNIDLNLLVTFSYLYRYRSVSIAADKSFVSQSAMSHSLGVCASYSMIHCLCAKGTKWSQLNMPTTLRQQ
ncbi:LysR-like transcriptional regulator [Vibrio ponticus]|nr:LysR-like transcriptional regulator [Vibrio ponticus]